MLIGIDREVAELDERVELRVDRMFAAGLVDEVRLLAGKGLRDGKTASRALGYQQVLAKGAAGFVVIDIECVTERPHAGSGRGRIQIARAQLMQSPRVEITDAQSSVTRQRSLDADR